MNGSRGRPSSSSSPTSAVLQVAAVVFVLMSCSLPLILIMNAPSLDGHASAPQELAGRAARRLRTGIIGSGGGGSQRGTPSVGGGATAVPLGQANAGPSPPQVEVGGTVRNGAFRRGDALHANRAPKTAHNRSTPAHTRPTASHPSTYSPTHLSTQSPTITRPPIHLHPPALPFTCHHPPPFHPLLCS